MKSIRDKRNENILRVRDEEAQEKVKGGWFTYTSKSAWKKQEKTHGEDTINRGVGKTKGKKRAIQV